MKTLNFFTLFLLLFSWMNVLGQTTGKPPKQEYEKIGVYKTRQGKVYNENYFDSLRAESYYTGKRKVRETEDSVYYSVVQFDLALTAERYQAEGFYCGNTDRKSLDEIKKMYPYKQTVSIKVVSFECCAMPMTNGKIDFSRMTEVKTLDAELTDKMMDILANYVNTEKSMEISLCWNPRDAVILLDKDGHVIACVEICFECQKYQTYPEGKLFGSFCNEKLDAILGIMMRAGL